MEAHQDGSWMRFFLPPLLSAPCFLCSPRLSIPQVLCSQAALPHPIPQQGLSFPWRICLCVKGRCHHGEMSPWGGVTTGRCHHGQCPLCPHFLTLPVPSCPIPLFAVELMFAACSSSHHCCHSRAGGWGCLIFYLLIQSHLEFPAKRAIQQSSAGGCHANSLSSTVQNAF